MTAHGGAARGGGAARRGTRLAADGDDDVAAVLARRARFSRWDGSQLLPELDADEILDALTDDVMGEGDLAEALRRLMERGWRSGDPTRPDLPGLQEIGRAHV